MEPINYDELNLELATPIEKIKENILDAERRNLAPIDTLLGSAPEGGTVALIGGGPSLSKTLVYALTQHKTIIIAGSPHDYVMERYILSSYRICNIYCMLCDADPIMKLYLKNKISEVTYLIASQCDPSVFDYLEDMPNKYIWHSAGKDNSIFKEGSKLVSGGCTIGTRAICGVIGMGFKKIHLYGYDSCLSKQYKHHAYEFEDPDHETLGDIRDVKLGGPDSPIFRVAGYMLGQILDFQNILAAFADKLDITVHGDGALAYLMQLAKEKSNIVKEE